MSLEDEIARYQWHRNRIEDEGYVRFLMPVIHCLKRHGVSGRVLDYGAGPEPVLTALMIRAGFDARGYDPHFQERYEHDGVIPGSGGFEAVVSTEVFEHFREPMREMDRLQFLVKPGGLLVVMTALVTEGVKMATWHYANDATHIVFYSEATFGFIARRWGFRMVECDGGRLVVLRRAT